MEHGQDIKALKNFYQKMKNLGKEDRIMFLDSIVSYCKYIGFNKEKTLMMLALIRNFLPEQGQKFTDCEVSDEVDNEFTKKIIDTYDLSQ